MVEIYTVFGGITETGPNEFVFVESNGAKANSPLIDRRPYGESANSLKMTLEKTAKKIARHAIDNKFDLLCSHLGFSFEPPYDTFIGNGYNGKTFRLDPEHQEDLLKLVQEAYRSERSKL